MKKKILSHSLFLFLLHIFTCNRFRFLFVIRIFFVGGGKIWECTEDLGDFLTTKSSSNASILSNIKGKYVLDLGCGAGILGLLALKAGAIVHFQDYVIQFL